MTRSNDSIPTIAIVGAGFSGTVTAVQLARKSAGRNVRIVVIEPSGKFGSGVAYGTRCTRHVLNVPAGNMSALPDEPTHFVEWTRRHGINDSPDAFVPRYWYGVYLHDLLEEARAEGRIERVAARVSDIVPSDSGARVMFETGEELRADAVILAGGNFRPSDGQLAGSGLLESPRYVRDPWRAKALENIASADEVLLVGTGLTMVDVVVQLRSSGHRGRINAVSRRGLVPQAHRKPNTHFAMPVPPEILDAPRTASGLLQGVRRAVRRIAKEGHDWRDVISSLRPRTVELWTSLSMHERARFLRHIRPFWDTHRHRIPADVDEDIQRLRHAGVLVVHRARVAGSEPIDREGRLRVQLQPRDGSATREVVVSWVVNCTGPDSDVRRVEEPLWSRMLARGVVQPDPLGLGVVTAPDGALLDRHGRPSDHIYLVGPLRKAQLWESTAVPELRVQAADLAAKLLDQLPSAEPAQDTWRKLDVAMSTTDSGNGGDFVPVYIGEHI